MATLVIRNIEAAIHARLKASATYHGRSMEEEARCILRQGLEGAALDAPQSFGQAMRAIFEPIGGVEFPEVAREPPGEPHDFAGPEWQPSK